MLPYNQTKRVFVWRDFLSRPLTNIQTIRGARREAGTLPRSPRIKWGAGTPDAPLQLPSGTERMLMNAALASVYASSSRRLAVPLRMKRSGDELPPCTWSGCGGRLNGVAVVTGKRGGGGDATHCALSRCARIDGTACWLQQCCRVHWAPVYGMLHVAPVYGLLDVVRMSFGHVV